jgi:gas vesicle protein
MHYDDRSRRYNLFSGLVFGAVLGAGLALLLAPPNRELAARGRSAGRAARQLRRDALFALEDARDGAADAARRQRRGR